MTYTLLLLELFWEFLKIGVFAVGGGMATLPFLYDLGEKTAWFTSAQVLDMLAVSESTPGPIGINMATYVGYSVGGIPGAILATLGTILPGLILVIVLAKFLARFHDNRFVNAAFYGLRPASTALIAAAGIGVLGESLFNPALFEETGNIADFFSVGPIVLAVVIWVMTNFIKPTKKWHPVIYIAASAVIGIAFKLGGA